MVYSLEPISLIITVDIALASSLFGWELWGKYIFPIANLFQMDKFLILNEEIETIVYLINLGMNHVAYTVIVKYNTIIFSICLKWSKI